MAISTDEVRSILNDLAQVCKDGEDGFREAAEKVTRPDLKIKFSEFSAQRSKFASELQTTVAKLGGEPSKAGSLSAAAHRGWLNLKSMVSGHDDAAIISECESGEDVAVKHYREALTKDIPLDVRNLIETQAKTVQETHNTVRALEVRTSKA